MSERLTNWAGNYTFGAARVHRPESMAELREVVAGSRTLRALGSRHSFNGIADSEELVSLERLPRSISVDRERGLVRVTGGMTYGELCGELHRHGFALRNLASLPHISVAGACATATHGSGDENANLAAAVTALEVMTADGTAISLSREKNGEEFNGCVVSLGGLGVVTGLTLDVVPAFMLQQEVFEDLPVAEVAAHFDEITASGYSVSLFTDWQGDRFSQVWLKRRVTDGSGAAPVAAFFGATPASVPRHPIVTLSADCCTEQMGVAGPWHERLPHFRMDHTPSSGEELQSEYYVPRRHAVAALQAVASLGPRMAGLLQISEVRTIAADSLWMSPCYRQPSVAIHFTWTADWPAVSALPPLLEEALAPFGARPHWGKLFTTAPQRIRSLYPKLPAFRELLRRYDPTGKFRNAFLDQYVFAGE